MDFVIRKHGRHLLLDIKKSIFDNELLEKLFEFIDTNIKNVKCLALNLNSVKNFDNSNIIKKIYSKGIALYGAQAGLTTQIYLLGQKNIPKIYYREEDFIENKRVFTRRRFRLIK